MTQSDVQCSERRKRILIGQLGSYGDCLYATTVARQIKNDYPGCHLTWAVGSLYRTILDGNPYIDDVWEFPLSTRNDLLDRWQMFEDEALKRKSLGDFDEIFLTQVFPNNLRYFDGTLRSSIFRAYENPITVPVAPVLRLSPKEVESVRLFALSHLLSERKNVVLFECSPKSGQSFVYLQFALDVSMKLIEEVPDTCIILSSSESFHITDKRIIDGSVLSFRENAELTKYCTLLVGCSSGISWLCTSDWAKPLPMVQLLSKGTNMYASFVYDHEFQGIAVDTIIEMTDCSEHKLFQCLKAILTEGFDAARMRYHESIRVGFSFYTTTIINELVLKSKYIDAIMSLRHTVKRYGIHPQLFIKCFIKIFNGLAKQLVQSLSAKFHKAYMSANLKR